MSIRAVRLASSRLLIPLLLLSAAVGCGETSSAGGSGRATGANSTTASSTIPGELPIGERPSIPVKPYWFGETVGEAEAVVAKETRLHNGSSRYDVYYELPSAGGKSSADLSQAPPPGEIHVISILLRGPVARQMVESYMVGGHSPIVLANGEAATLLPDPGPSALGFAVVTKRTLVQVIGPAVTPLVNEQEQDLAVRLRPL